MSCGFRFEAADKKNCPRCSSAEVSSFSNRRDENVPSSSEAPHRAPTSFGPLKSGKEGWKSFHSNEMVVCPDCSGKEFDLNWKRKEKTCRKCGAVLALPRRSA